MSIQHTVYCTRPCTFHQQYQTPQHTNDSTLKSLVTKICTKQRTQLQISPKFTGCVQLGSVQGSDHTKIYRVHSSVQSGVWLNIIQRKSMSERNWAIKLLPQEQSQHIIFVEVGVDQTRRQHDVQVHRKLYIPV